MHVQQLLYSQLKSLGLFSCACSLDTSEPSLVAHIIGRNLHNQGLKQTLGLHIK